MYGTKGPLTVDRPEPKYGPGDRLRVKHGLHSGKTDIVADVRWIDGGWWYWFGDDAALSDGTIAMRHHQESTLERVS